MWDMLIPRSAVHIVSGDVKLRNKFGVYRFRKERFKFEHDSYCTGNFMFCCYNLRVEI